MIRLSDGALLALTKLQTRRVRTIVTAVTASLLFGGLVGAILVIGGVVQSATNFTKGSLSERYITNVQYFGNGASSYDDSSLALQTRATELYTKLVSDKKADAKRLGVDYDPDMEQRPVVKEPSGESRLDESAPTAQQAIAEYQATQPTDLEKLRKAAAPYHPLKVYDMQASNIPAGTMNVMKNGVEDFTMPNKQQNGYGGAPDVSQGWSYLGVSLTAPFLLSKAQLAEQKNTGDLPVIAPYSKVETALNLPTLPKDAPATERMNRIATVREKAAKVTFTACYRNSVSAMQISDARGEADEAKKHKNDASYKQPSLQYGLPAADSCAGALVIRDVRSAAEKQQTEKELQFKRDFNEVADPVQQKVTFRVVGIGPDGLTSESFSAIGMLVSAVAGSSLQGLWVVPQNMYDAMPNKADYARFEPSAAGQQSMNFAQSGQLVEFATAKDAKAFVTKVGCTDMDCGRNKPYISYFGSNSVLLADMVTGITKGLAIAVLIVASIAALIMMGMVGRVIGDSRRETAVFRAIGAKRNDIRAIYVIYTILLSSIVAVMALLIGVGAALWVDGKWSAGATAQAQVTFIGAHGGEQFHLIGVWWQALAVIVAVVIITGLVSMLLPLSRNLARSPIKDMRDDT